jgi:uncharacterized phage protein gp47/JayE
MAIAGRYIPVPNLDDRDWQAIRDAMVRKIPEKCPEWTDHNPSDPGITLIELFALQIEELTFRLNQVLPKHKREFLNMIGVTLTPPSAAKVTMFFKLSAKQTFDVTVSKGFEISTGTGAGEEPIVFTTDRDLVIHAARILRCLGYQNGEFIDCTAEANDPATVFNPLPNPLVSGDALYIAFHEDNYFEKLAITIETPVQGGIGGFWEYYRRNPDGTFEWAELPVEDGTERFSQTEDVTFTVPGDWESCEVNGFRATWLRYRIAVDEEGLSFAFLQLLEIDNIWGRVSASNAAQVAEEILGSSDGKIDQRFYLSNVPVLDCTVLIDEGSSFEVWQEVDDLSTSGPTDKHYQLNRGTGEILFGDGRHGKIPSEGNNNVKVSPYRYGGGSRGNVGAGTINQLRSSHVYIDSCINKEPATGGGDEETVDEAVERGPREQLKTRNRAVTTEDFETLALESSTGIARAKALPLYNPANPSVETPGVVTVIVMPKGGGVASQAMRDAVRTYLDEWRLVTAQLYVTSPDYITVSVQAQVVKKSTADALSVQNAVKAALAEFLDPEYGGDAKKAAAYVQGESKERGSGWEFGRDVYLSELYELMESVSGVDHVEAITVPAETIELEKVQLPILGEHIVTVNGGQSVP